MSKDLHVYDAIIANTFTPNMLPKGGVGYAMLRELSDLEVAKAVVQHGKTCRCVIGHPATAQIAKELGLVPESVECKREQLVLTPGHYKIITITVGVRLPEGKVLGLEEIKKYLSEDKIRIFLVDIEVPP
jgi:hypothetical protein